MALLPWSSCTSMCVVQGPDESKGDRKALLERAQADLRELQRIATALQVCIHRRLNQIPFVS